jgi:hypothetical protein
VGAPLQHPWELGLAFTGGFHGRQEQGGAWAAASGSAISGVRLQRRLLPYPQPLALLPALHQAETWLLGKLLAVVGPATQLQLLDALVAAVSAKGVVKKDPSSVRCAAAVQGGALGRGGRGKSGGGGGEGGGEG